MITIEYCQEGTPVSDFEYSDWIYNVKKSARENEYTKFKVSTSLPIDMVRLAIVNNELDCEKVTFLYLGQVFHSDGYGVIVDWPKGFCDRNIAASQDIVLTATRKRKKSLYKTFGITR